MKTLAERNFPLNKLGLSSLLFADFKQKSMFLIWFQYFTLHFVSLLLQIRRAQLRKLLTEENTQYEKELNAIGKALYQKRI